MGYVATVSETCEKCRFVVSTRGSKCDTSEKAEAQARISHHYNMQSHSYSGCAVVLRDDMPLDLGPDNTDALF